MSNDHKPIQKRPLLEEAPWSKEAEEGILSCLLQKPEWIPDFLGKIKGPEVFYHPCNRIIWELFLEFHKKKKPIDLILLSHHLLGTSTMDKIGGPSKLAELYGFVPTTAHYPYYLSILQEKDRIRKCLGLCDSLKRVLLSNSEEWKSEALPDANKLLSQLTESDETSKSIKDMVFDVSNDWQDEFSGKASHWTPTRWRCWNQVLGGMSFPSYVLLLGARSSGKSSLGQNLITSSITQQEPVKCAEFLYEMSESDFIKRAICDLSGVHSRYLFMPGVYKPDQDTIRKIAAATRAIEKSPLHLYKRTDWNANRVIEELYRIRPRIAVVDYLQLLPPPDDCEKGKSFEVAKSSQLFCQASVDLNMCLVLLSQRSSSESRGGEASWSDAPENDATLCLSIEKDGVGVRKQRHGERDVKIPILMEKGYYRFIESVEETEDEVPV